MYYVLRKIDRHCESSQEFTRGEKVMQLVYMLHTWVELRVCAASRGVCHCFLVGVACILFCAGQDLKIPSL